jgi:hypothetical protein
VGYPGMWREVFAARLETFGSLAPSSRKGMFPKVRSSLPILSDTGHR